jgi:hypothetical protein
VRFERGDGLLPLLDGRNDGWQIADEQGDDQDARHGLDRRNDLDCGARPQIRET